MVFLIETSRIQISHLPIIELSKNQSVIPYLVNMRLNGFTKGLKNVISSEGFFFFGKYEGVSNRSSLYLENQTILLCCIMGASSEFSIRQKVYSRLGVEIFFLSIMLNN